MATAIRVPRVGQAAEEATLVAWLRTTGDAVVQGDVVATIETDKVEIEVESPVAGIVGELRAYEGEVYPIGAVMVYVLGDGEDEPHDVPPAEPAPAPRTDRAVATRVAASPRARRIADERGIDLARVAGSGPDGLITERDVESHTTTSDIDLWQGRRVRSRHRLESLRARTARHLAETWSTTPQFAQMVDVDMTYAIELHAATGATYTELVVAALARSLVGHPRLNAAYDKGDLVEFDEINIAIAVETTRGLEVPVIRNADRLDLAGLSAACRGAVDRARADELALDECSGASATVSNLGAHGITAGTPVINGPEALLAFMGAVESRAVVRDGGIVVRSMMTLSIAFDHRVVDGVAAAAFVASVKRLLETIDALG
ncbi:MAG TPA: dihydrolipoamide acetyltransferase family protein [Acidimicrobiales bacterium]|nr:dihydrolipoamide acetyltransferase family protein [Acidimicrobiales bacterium]